MEKLSDNDNMKEIYLAGGCFWGLQHYLDLVRGVCATEVGYANSVKPQPTYEEVCSGTTCAAETVKVDYDPEVLPLPKLLEIFFKAIDPFSVNKQGGDEGLQYRSGIYYTSADDAHDIHRAVEHIEETEKRKVATEVMPLSNFYPAEDYHQEYLDKNPGGYCHIAPGLFSYAREANEGKPL